MKLKISPQDIKKDRMYGTTVVGTRGQVVIPADARRDLKIRAGDRLVVMGKMGKALGMVKMDEFGELIDVMMKSISNKSDKQMLKKHIQKLLTGINK